MRFLSETSLGHDWMPCKLFWPLEPPCKVWMPGAQIYFSKLEKALKFQNKRCAINSWWQKETKRNSVRASVHIFRGDVVYHLMTMLEGYSHDKIGGPSGSAHIYSTLCIHSGGITHRVGMAIQVSSKMVPPWLLDICSTPWPDYTRTTYRVTFAHKLSQKSVLTKELDISDTLWRNYSRAGPRARIAIKPSKKSVLTR